MLSLLLSFFSGWTCCRVWTILVRRHLPSPLPSFFYFFLLFFRSAAATALFHARARRLRRRRRWSRGLHLRPLAVVVVVVAAGRPAPSALSVSYNSIYWLCYHHLVHPLQCTCPPSSTASCRSCPSCPSCPRELPLHHYHHCRNCENCYDYPRVTAGGPDAAGGRARARTTFNNLLFFSSLVFSFFVFSSLFFVHIHQTTKNLRNRNESGVSESETEKRKRVTKKTEHMYSIQYRWGVCVCMDGWKTDRVFLGQSARQSPPSLVHNP